MFCWNPNSQLWPGVVGVHLGQPSRRMFALGRYHAGAAQMDRCEWWDMLRIAMKHFFHEILWALKWNKQWNKQKDTTFDSLIVWLGVLESQISWQVWIESSLICSRPVIQAVSSSPCQVVSHRRLHYSFWLQQLNTIRPIQAILVSQPI